MKNKTLLKLFPLIIIGIFFILFINTEARTINLDEAIKIALLNNRDTKIAKMNVDKAHAAVHEAYGYAYPSVDLSGNFTHFFEKPMTPFPDFAALLTDATYQILAHDSVRKGNGEYFTYDPNGPKPGTVLQSFVLSNSYEAKVQASQVLFNSAVFQGIGAAQVYHDLSKEGFKSAIIKTVLDVKKAYYSVLLTKSLMEISEASFKNAEDNYNNVKALLAQGLVSEFDALQAEVQVENFRPVMLQMENTYKNAKNGMKITLGIDPKEDIDVTGELTYQNEDIPQEKQALDRALSWNYDLRTLKQKNAFDNEMISINQADYWPSLAAFGSYSFAGSADKFDFLHYRVGVVGVQLSMSLFKGFQTANKVEQAQISYQQSSEQYLQLKDYLNIQVKSKILDLETVKIKIDAQELNISHAQKAFEISNLRYKDGTGNQLEVQNAEMALRQAKTNKLQSVYEYIIAKSELENLLGQIDENYFKTMIK